MIVTQNWYNLNSVRRYPLDSAVTGEDDDGRSLPHDIFVDCHFRLPESIGEYIYISAVHVSDALISAVFSASVEPAYSTCGASSAGSDVAIASVNVPRANLVPGRQVPISAMYPGIGGWVVFGECKNDIPYTGRFSSPKQSLLLPRVARRYRTMPVPDMGKLYFDRALTGLVLLRGGNDIEIVKEARDIDGTSVDAIVVRLKDQPGRNLLSEYVGPCGARPESGNCLKPAIETINTVTPDCEGNIDIEFETDCLKDAVATGNEGIVLDYCLGLSDACISTGNLPSNGILPNEYDDLCEDSSSSSQSSESSAESSSSDSSLSSSMSTAPESSCSSGSNGNDFSTDANGFAVKSGAFNVESGYYKSKSTASTNLSIWEPCYYTEAATGETWVSLPANDNAHHRGGLVFQYRLSQSSVVSTLGATRKYFVAEINKETDAFEVRAWTGAGYVLVANAGPVGLKFDNEYKITVAITKSGTLWPVLVTLYDTVASATLATIAMQLPQDIPGIKYYFGVHAYQSLSDFNAFQVS